MLVELWEVACRWKMRSPFRLSAVLDSARLLFDLQHVSQIVQSISGCLEPRKIAHHLTDGLITQFDCVFARLWIVEPDQSTLRLIASSGLHTHTNGAFARLPMGAYKVGNIAQNRINFSLTSFYL